jgi:hypothetical protein
MHSTLMDSQANYRTCMQSTLRAHTLRHAHTQAPHARHTELTADEHPCLCPSCTHCTPAAASMQNRKEGVNAWRACAPCKQLVLTKRDRECTHSLSLSVRNFKGSSSSSAVGVLFISTSSRAIQACNRTLTSLPPTQPVTLHAHELLPPPRPCRLAISATHRARHRLHVREVLCALVSPRAPLFRRWDWEGGSFGAKGKMYRQLCVN